MSAATSPIQVLREELGALGLARVALSLAARSLWDRPFAHLPPAAGERERLSREQARPAVLLYRVLRRLYPRERALAVARRVVTQGAIAHLEQTLGDLDPSAWAGLDAQTRRQRAQGWLDRFFTATATLDEASEDRVRFRVTACALVRLSMAAGHPELATTFCAGDGAFFASRQPPIELRRETTLAEAGPCCPFELTLGG